MPGEHRVAFQLRSFTSPVLQHGHQYAARVVRGDYDKTFAPVSCQYGSIRCPVAWQGSAIVHFKSGGPAPHGYQAKMLVVELHDAAKGKGAIGKAQIDVTRALRTDQFQGVVEGLEVEFRMAGLGASVVVDLAVFPSTCPQPAWPSQVARQQQQQQQQQNHQQEVMRAAAESAVAAGGRRAANSHGHRRTPASVGDDRGDPNSRARAIAMAVGAPPPDAEPERVDMSESKRALDAETARHATLKRAADLEQRLRAATMQLVITATRDRAVATVRHHWATGDYEAMPPNASDDANDETTRRRRELEADIEQHEHGAAGAEESIADALAHLDAMRSKLEPLRAAQQRRDDVVRRQQALERAQAERDVTDEAVALFAELDAADSAVQEAKDALDLDEDGGESGLRDRIASHEELMEQLRAIRREDQRAAANARAELARLDDDVLERATAMAELNRARRDAVVNAVARAVVAPPEESKKSKPSAGAPSKDPTAAAAPAAAGPSMDDLFGGGFAAASAAAPPPAPRAAAVSTVDASASRHIDPFDVPNEAAHPDSGTTGSFAPKAPAPDLFAPQRQPTPVAASPAASESPARAATSRTAAPDLFGPQSEATPATASAPDLFGAASTAGTATRPNKPQVSSAEENRSVPDLFGPTRKEQPRGSSAESVPAAPQASSASAPVPAPRSESDLFSGTTSIMVPQQPPPAKPAGLPSQRSLAAPASELEADLFFGQQPVAAASTRSSAAAVPAKRAAVTAQAPAATFGVDNEDDLFGNAASDWPPAAAAPNEGAAASATDLFAPAPKNGTQRASRPESDASASLFAPTSDGARERSGSRPHGGAAFDPFGRDRVSRQREEVADEDLFA